MARLFPSLVDRLYIHFSEMRRLLPIACLLLFSLALAEEEFNYEETIAYLRERTASPLPDAEVAYTLGPSYLEEFYEEDGKERKFIAYYAKAFSLESYPTVGKGVDQANISTGQHVVTLYRKGEDRPVVRIEGTGYQLPTSQFRLQGGDIIVIRTKDDNSPFAPQQDRRTQILPEDEKKE
ncbi:MAG: hypothetical protein CMO55_08870 [Verrucomicrobiales bacterium]|nr:hypothetical protein [Verrucomicrobiales bacterium]